MNSFPGSLVDIEYYLPETVIDNSFFQSNFPDWKVEQTQGRTGVLSRHIARSDETAYDLALNAVKKLLKQHPALTDKLDAIIFCTQTPDYIMPSNAFLLQKDLGLNHIGIAYDFNLACSGYIYGLAMASSFIKTGMAKNILLVTADTYSKLLDENDRATRMLFGDGASASWISADDFDGIKPLISKFEDFKFSTDGKGWDKFIVKAGGNRHPVPMSGDSDFSDKIYMNGMQVVNFVNHQVIKQVVSLLEQHNLKDSQIDQYFFHQASLLAIESLSKRLKLPKDKVFTNIEKVGNTVSSSIPILLKDYFAQSKPDENHKFLLCGFGVGFSWGTLIATR